MPNNLYLVGFMGSGKTTVGKLLARKLKWPFLDTDQEIEKCLKLSITQIFEKYGAERFRAEEKKELKKLIRKSNHVISLGGGSLINKENLTLTQSNGVLVYLKASTQTLISNLNHQTNQRPLLANLSKRQQLIQIRKLLQERKTTYEKCSYIIKIDNLTPLDIAQKIIKDLINL